MVVSVPVRIGVYNDVNLQQAVIALVCRELGSDVYKCSVGSGHRTKLEEALRKAKAEILPTATTRQLRRWFNFFLKYGLTRAEYSRTMRRRKPRRYHRRTNRGSWTDDDTRLLKGIVQKYPELYLDEIKDKFFILSRGRRDWSDATIWMRLVSDCNYSLQVATDRALLRSEEEQQKYKAALEKWVHKPDQLIYIDETQKDRNSSWRRRYWSLRGQTPFRNAYFAGTHAKRYTLLAACDLNGFVLGACETVQREHGDTDNDPTRGTVDRERFIMWVETKLVPCLGNYVRGEDRSVVVMDNASIHHDPDGRIEALIHGASAKLLYLSPYSPELNPIELMFNEYKKTLKRRHKDRWLNAHIHGLLSVDTTMAKHFFRKCDVPLSEEEVDSSGATAEETAAAMAAVLCTMVFLKRKPLGH